MKGAIDQMRTEEIWKQDYRGGYPDKRWIALPGFDNLRNGLELGGPKPPMSHLIGMTFDEVERDHVTFSMPASDWFLSSQDLISVGPLLMLADAALGCAVMIDLPPLTPYATSELSMTFLRSVHAGGVLRAIGTPLYDGRPLSMSQSWVEDSQGQRVAFATSSCFSMAPLPPMDPPPPQPPFVHPEYDVPDPYLRPISGATIPWDMWQSMSGLEILQRQISGELPQPPIHYLTGMTLQDASSGTAVFSMPAGKWLTSPLGTVQGGALAMIAHAALASAVTTTLEPQTAYRPVDVKVNFLRPCFPTGEDLIATGTVIHRGRTLAVATADLRRADGKKIVTATGSTIIQPGRDPLLR